MLLRDFIYSFFQSLTLDLKKKNFFKCFKKILYYPYKFFLDKVRELFLIKKFKLDYSKKLTNYKNYQLDQLFYTFNADKGSKFFLNNKKRNGHNYTPYYEKYLSKYKKKKNLKILEIGSLRGAATASFYYYFNNPKIVCADINPFQIQAFSKQVRKIFINTRSDESISNFSKYVRDKFDIIIDDGSHNIRDQIISFNILFRKLIKHGMYVIEDASQYKAMKNLNLDNLKFGSKEILFSIIKGNFNERKYLSKDDVKKLGSKIKKIHVKKGKFTQKGINISEIIFVEKL